MNKFKNVTFTLRMITGGIIMLHGLLRIVFLGQYIEFVLTHFYDFVPTETGLTIGAAIMPFIEFFTGLLIMSNVNIRKTLVAAFCISLIMSFFILADSHLYPRLIYHVVIVGLLALVYCRVKKNQQTPTLSV